jgi:hypothetical protein
MLKFLLLLIFGTFASGIQISCRYTLFSISFTHIDDTPTCIVMSMDFSDNATHLTGTNGTIEQIESTEFILFGWWDSPCKEFNLTFVPQGLLNVFPNLEGIRFEGCPITNLIGDELVEYENFTSFILSSFPGSFFLLNGRVPPNFFSPTPNMKFIQLSNIAITRIGDKLFHHLDLQNLLLWGNICIDRHARNATAIAQLIEDVRIKCPDVDPTTTTTTPGSVETTSSPPPSSSMLKEPFLILVVLLLFMVGKM